MKRFGNHESQIPCGNREAILFIVCGFGFDSIRGSRFVIPDWEDWNLPGGRKGTADKAFSNIYGFDFLQRNEQD
jgi:hypothetical protein